MFKNLTNFFRRSLPALSQLPSKTSPTQPPAMPTEPKDSFAPAPNILSKFSNLPPSALRNPYLLPNVTKHSAFPTATSILQDIALTELQAKHALGHKQKLSAGVALGLKLNEKLHFEDSSLVTNDPIRKKTTSALSTPGHSVVWTEMNGVAELGGGKHGTLPLGTLAKLHGGFSAAALINYKAVVPMVVPNGDTLQELPIGGSPAIPLHRDALLSAAPGSEFEITGTGKVTADGGLQAGTGSFPGATVSANIKVKHEGQTGVNIRILDEPGLVQVTLKNLETDQHREGVDLYAGAAVPKIGQGYLFHVIENYLETPLRKLAEKYTSADASIASQTTDQSKDLGRYTLDISSPNGMKAYQSLLRLSTGAADQLSAVQGSGVSKASYEETSNVHELKASARVAGARLLLLQALETEKSGHAKNSQGKEILFRQNKFQAKQDSWFTGSRDSTWDALTVQRSEHSPPESFYNMRFNANDFYTTEKDVSRFFAFAEELGVREKNPSDPTMPEMGILERAFNDRDNTKVNVDVYFTANGINNIDHTTTDKARKTFLETKAEIFPSTIGLAKLTPETYGRALKLAEDYQNLQPEKFIEDTGYDLENSDLLRKYKNLTGRSLENDSPTLIQSDSFADHVGTLSGGKGQQNIRNFFTHVGKSQGTHYMSAIAALTKLAGRDETLVNKLSMKGDHINLEAASDGKIEHPTDTVASILNERRFSLQNIDGGSEV